MAVKRRVSFKPIPDPKPLQPGWYQIRVFIEGEWRVVAEGLCKQ